MLDIGSNRQQKARRQAGDGRRDRFGGDFERSAHKQRQVRQVPSRHKKKAAAPFGNGGRSHIQLRAQDYVTSTSM
jgi:hypothetical protein